MTLKGVLLLLLLCRFETGQAHESSGFTIDLPDRENVCFYEDFEGTKTYVFEYKVIKGGNYDVDVNVTSPTGSEIFGRVRSSDGEFKFEISWGTYRFCFSNEFSTMTHKLIYFELRPEEHGRLAFESGKKGPSQNTQSEESLESIHTAATEVMAFQVKYRLEEAKDRNNAEKLNRKVMFLSLFHTSVIMVVGLGELFILKKFFTHKRVPLKQPVLSH